MRRTGPSLKILALTTTTDDREPVGAWPAPLPKVAEVEPGRLDPEWPALPIDPGGWGRPPVAFTEPEAEPAWVPTRAPAAGSLAPTPAPPVGPIRRRRRRRDRALAEAAAAVILLTGLALIAPGGGAGRAPAESGGLTRWSTNALPVLTRLANDCTAVAHDSGSSSALASGWQRDAAHFRADLNAAQRLPAPPDTELAQAWRSMLSQLGATSLDLPRAPDANQEAQVRTGPPFAAAGTVVREFEQAIRPAR